MSGRKAGKGPLVQEEMSATLGISQDQYLFQPIAFDGYNQAVTGGVTMPLRSKSADSDHIPIICYNISPYASNAMMSSNPHSAIQEIDTVRTLDLNGGNPACNQGG